MAVTYKVQRTGKTRDLLKVRMSLFVQKYPSYAHVGVLAKLFNWSATPVKQALELLEVEINEARTSADTLFRETVEGLAAEDPAKCLQFLEDMKHVKAVDELSDDEIDELMPNEMMQLGIASLDFEFEQEDSLPQAEVEA